MRLSETTFKIPTTIVVYGDPGVGKSEFLASTNTERSLLVTDGNGARTFFNKRVKSMYPNFNPHVIQVDTGLTPQEKQKAWIQFRDGIGNWFKPDKINEWDWILIDDCSILQLWAIVRALTINSEMGRSKSLSYFLKTGDMIPTIADYGTEISLMELMGVDLIGECIKNNKHCVIAAHEKRFFSKNKETKEDELKAIEPNFTGRQAPKHLVGRFDFIFRLTRIGKGTNSYVQFQCHPDGIVLAKDRDAVFGTFEKNLTIKTVMEKTR
jgi:hypothetical protein